MFVQREERFRVKGTYYLNSESSLGASCVCNMFWGSSDSRKLPPNLFYARVTHSLVSPHGIDPSAPTPAPTLFIAGPSVIIAAM